MLNKISSRDHLDKDHLVPTSLIMKFRGNSLRNHLQTVVKDFLHCYHPAQLRPPTYWDIQVHVTETGWSLSRVQQEGEERMDQFRKQEDKRKGKHGVVEHLKPCR